MSYSAKKLWYSGNHSYEGILDEVSENILLVVTDGYYQGESYALVHKEGRFGVVEWSYGSCAHCDAIEACETVEEFEEVYEDMVGRIKWDTLTRTLLYIEEHDWEGQAGYHYDALKVFPEKAKKVLLAFANGFVPWKGPLANSIHSVLAQVAWMEWEAKRLKRQRISQEPTEKLLKTIEDFEERVSLTLAAMEGVKKYIK